MSVIGSNILAGASGAAGGGSKVYVDDVFSTFLYDGNEGSNQINNGIDLAGEGGLVWFKNRTRSGDSPTLIDTETQSGGYLISNGTAGLSGTQPFSSFNSNGYTINSGSYYVNDSSHRYASWSFRKAPGFFDVVTYTGNNTAGRTVAHNLGSVPGMIVVKCLNDTEGWHVYHRSIGATKYLLLNSTSPENSGSTVWNNTTPTSTHFTVSTNPATNGNGLNYVAYIFAHDDAQFGTGGDESIIKCGTYAGNGNASNVVNIGFEPQWLLVKASDANYGWIMLDNMRGIVAGSGDDRFLSANSSDEEQGQDMLDLTSTGFIAKLNSNTNASGKNYIYMAIRRPHKPPEAGTDVFDDVAYTGTGSANTVSFSPAFADLIWIKNLVYGYPHVLVDRLRGNTKYLSSNSNAIEATLATADSVLLDRQESFKIPGPGYSGGQTNNGNAGYNTYISWVFKRAPGFMDVVAYSGTGSATTINHNLEVVPELMIVKSRSISDHWQVYSSVTDETDFLMLNSTNSTDDQVSKWNDTAPTSSVFTVGSDTGVNQSSATYIAYLFATLPGISKVGTYTATGSALNIDCGFTSGARFVLIKRYDTSGNWFVLDTARGIVSGNDPLLELNTNSAQDSSYDNLDPYNQGFTVTAYGGTSPYLNISGGTYLFLAIA